MIDIIDCDLSQIRLKYFNPVIYPCLYSYAATVQDTVWHAEGDVHIHTDMVMNEVRTLINQYQLNVTDALILYTAAIFHDYAKPLTTDSVFREHRLCITAKGHEEMGASLLTFTPPPSYLTDDQWQTVIELVRYHDKPKMMAIRHSNNHDYWRLKLNCPRLDLLYLLEVADMKGRICNDLDDQLFYLEMFKHQAESFGVYSLNVNDFKEDFVSEVLANWSQYSSIVDKVYSTLISRFVDIDNPKAVSQTNASEYSAQQLYNWMVSNLPSCYGMVGSGSPHLVILCGLSGAGKTTYIRNTYVDYQVVSLDDIRSELTDRADQSNNELVVRLAHKRVAELLKERKNVVYDATNYRKDFRTKLAQVGFNYLAFVEIVLIKTTLSTCLINNKKRPVDETVSDDVIFEMQRRFQLPDVTEAHKFTIISSK